MKHEYSNDIYNARVALLGPLPPPLGGVSVHVERMIAKLQQQNNCVSHFDTTNEIRYKKFFGIMVYCIRLFFFLIINRPSIIMYHTTYLRNALIELLFLVCFKKILSIKFLLIEHDCRFVYHLTESQKTLYAQIVASVDTQIFIGSQTQQSFRDVGLCAQQTNLEAAFLPPDTRNAQQLRLRYPVSLHRFLQAHTSIILANAFQLSMLNGKDLYGFDQLIEAFARYHKSAPQAGLVLMLAQKGDVQLFDAIQQSITSQALDPHIYILVGNYLLWPLFAYADLFVRPTLSDGESVSVQEALYFGVPVVASDVCVRPQQCIKYEPANTTDLARKLSYVLMR